MNIFLKLLELWLRVLLALGVRLDASWSIALDVYCRRDTMVLRLEKDTASSNIVLELLHPREKDSTFVQRRMLKSMRYYTVPT